MHLRGLQSRFGHDLSENLGKEGQKKGKGGRKEKNRAQKSTSQYVYVVYK